MKTTITEQRHGFLASLKQIEDLIIAYGIGRIENVIAKTAVAAGNDPSACLAQMSYGDIDSWIQIYLASSIEKAKKENSFSLDYNASIPGKMDWLGIRGTKDYKHEDFYFEVWNRQFGTILNEYNQLILETFADYLGVTTGLEILVSAEIPTENGLFRLDWSKFLDQIKSLFFEESFRGVTGNGLAGLIVGQMQMSHGIKEFVPYCGPYMIYMRLDDYGTEDNDRKAWRVDGDVLIGPAKKGPGHLNFYFVEKMAFQTGVPILVQEDQVKATEIATALVGILEAS